MRRGITVKSGNEVELVRVFRRREDGTEEEVTEAVYLGGGKANLFGYSTAKLVCRLEVDGFALRHEIGEHYCGDITLSDPRYRFELEPIDRVD